LRVGSEAHLQAEKRGDDPIDDDLGFGVVWAATSAGFCRLDSMELFLLRSNSSGDGRPTGLNVELLCVLSVQPLLADELHSLGARRQLATLRTMAESLASVAPSSAVKNYEDSVLQTGDNSFPGYR
jgi:hypothetical protein